MIDLIGERLHTGFYSAVDPEAEDTVLLIANELGSPLHSTPAVTDANGDFGKFTRRIADAGYFQSILQHERLGSADQTYDSLVAAALAPEQRPEAIRQQADIVLQTIRSTFPRVQRIIGLAHSGGAVQLGEIARAIAEYDLLRKAGLGSVALSNLVLIDPPRKHDSLIGGLLRFGLYQPYERFLLTQPPKGPDEQDATPGATERARIDIRYNMRRWVQGTFGDLHWIADNMPETEVYIAAARHSPNNIGRLPGYLRRSVVKLNGLRGDSGAARPFRAESYPGPHSIGSRSTLVIDILERAGVRR